MIKNFELTHQNQLMFSNVDYTVHKLKIIAGLDLITFEEENVYYKIQFSKC